MPIIHVRNVPAELYTRIEERARKQNRSISAEIIQLLSEAIEDSDAPASEILAGIRRRRFFNPREVGAPDSTTLLREDRQR